MALSSQPNFAPGGRVVIRDAEWVIRKVDLSSDGGWQITCDGISELVRNTTGMFLTRLEGDIQVLDPGKTTLIPDESPGYRNSLLYMESLLRRAVPSDERIHVAHRAAMDLVPYQLDPALQALKQPRQRILIADAVGLGKTLEAGILVSELIHRGKGKRILVLTLKSMLTQFQKEFWSRFTIPLTRLDSAGLQRVRNRIPTNHNPFYYYDRAIISIDTLKQDSEYRNWLEQAWWDIIIIDEAHNVAERGNGGSVSMRARLAKLLATRSDTLIMLSATPHDGRARSFASLMNMLDPTAIADPDEYTHDDFRNKGLVVRRFKKDIQRQAAQSFQEREVFSHYHEASPEEESAYEALLEIPFTRKGEYANDTTTALQRVTLQKGLFSSPAACRQSVENRIATLERQAEQRPSDDIAEEIAGLEVLAERLRRIPAERHAKYQKLLALLKDKQRGWSPRKSDDRLVIFSERIETLHFLRDQLEQDLKLKDTQIALLHGQMSDLDQQRIVEAFGKPEEKLRLLLCSDVASEGINLHYLCHRLIHFDMPWSLMIFQQRNGRIDRYGQEKTPQIHYLITESRNPVIRGDTRILEVLREKDEQAYRNIGDPSVFMGVHDPREEEKLTEQAMAEGKQADAFDAELQPKKDPGEALLELFLGTGQGEESPAEQPDPTAQIADIPSLFSSHFDYCAAALNALNAEREPLQFSQDAASRHLSLVAPDDLRHRFNFMPREIIPDNWQFVLSDDIDAIKREIARSRQDENAWPKIHYLWPQHPIAEWLDDRMLAQFGRHQAPVIRLPQGLAPGERLFVISGLVPNRKSHPLIYEWLGVRYIGDRFQGIEPLADSLRRTGLGANPIPNRGVHTDIEPLQLLLPKAVEKARDWVIQRRNTFETEINRKLDEQLRELETLRAAQLRQLELALQRSGQPETIKQSRKAQRVAEIDRIFDQYIDWIEDTLTTEPEAWMQVIAVLMSED